MSFFVFMQGLCFTGQCLLGFLTALVGYFVYLIVSYQYHRRSNRRPVINYQIIGNKAGPILVFVHGWPDLPSYLWASQVSHFKKHYLCVLIELPNFHVNKQQNPWGYPIMTLVDAIADSIRSIVQQYSMHNMYQQNKVTIIGHDWGAALSILVCYYNPELISKICTLDIGGGSNNSLSIKLKCIMLTYQLLNICFFLMPAVLGTFLLRGAVAVMKAAVESRSTGTEQKQDKHAFPLLKYERRKQKSFLTAKSNYLYFYLYLSLICGGTALQKLGKGMRFVEEIPFLFIRAGNSEMHFYNEKWLRKLKATKGCKYLEFDCDHWISVACGQQLNAALGEFLQQK